MSTKWHALSSKVLLDHPRLLVTEETIQLPEGEHIQYLLADTGHDYVTVVAEREDEKILVIKEYAYPINATLLQFPEGLMAFDGETPIDCAARELQEEVGFKAEKLETIGWNLHMHRRNTRKNYVLAATGLATIEKTGGEIEESSIEVVWMSPHEIWGAIRNGEMTQKNALSAWSTYWAWKHPEL